MVRPLNAKRIGIASARAGIWNLLREPRTLADLRAEFMLVYPNLEPRFDTVDCAGRSPS